MSGGEVIPSYEAAEEEEEEESDYGLRNLLGFDVLPSEVSGDDVDTQSSLKQAAEVSDDDDDDDGQSNSKQAPDDNESRDSDTTYDYSSEEEDVAAAVAEEIRMFTPIPEEDVEVYAGAQGVHETLYPVFEQIKAFADHSDKGRRFFDILITAIAIPTKLYDQDDSFYSGLSWGRHRQVNDLWTEIRLKTKEGAPLSSFFKLFGDGEIDLKKYPLVAENVLAHVMKTYNSQLRCYGRLITEHYPGIQGIYPMVVSAKKIDSDVVDIVRCVQENLQISDVDYKKIFSELLGESAKTTVGTLILDAAYKIVTEALSEIDEIDLSKFCFIWETGTSKESLHSLVGENLTRAVYGKKDWFLFETQVTISPFKQLLDINKFKSSNEVEHLIQLAECCRRAERARFICKQHFVWAFQESGFVLPYWMELNGGPSKSDGDRPPYHIYANSIKLGKYLEIECVEVEHLAYASIFGDHMEWEPEQLEFLAKHYEELCSKGLERAEKAEKACPTYSFPSSLASIRSVYEDPSCEPVQHV